MKRIILLILSLCLILSSAIVANASSFADISDEQIGQNVDVLYMMGVVGGDQNGKFNPENSLTRAEFCKMAVEISGRGSQEQLYRNRTIFPDVLSTHWARGYINLAVALEEKIIVGNADGTFAPDKSISFAEATTMAMRMLGYTDADAGMLWPDGYMQLALEASVTEGISLGYYDKLSRADAAKLFCNLLSAKTKDGSDYASVLGSVYDDVVLMSDEAELDNGKNGAIATSAGNYMPKNGHTPSSLVGERGKLIVDENGYAISFIPDDGSNISIIASTVEAGFIKDSSGKTYTIQSDTQAYTTEKVSTYGELWMDIKDGTRVTLYFTDAGKIDGVFINNGSYDTSIVAYESFSGNPFTALLGGERDYSIYKNNNKASVGDIERYDVASYDKNSKILYVSDTKISGIYENAYPNTLSPSTVTVLGKDFDVLPAAVSELSKYSIGQSVTLLLTGDLKVAGVVSSSTVRSNAVGIVTEISESHAEVELFMGVTVEGDPKISAEKAESLAGQLVRVTSTGKGYISLTKLTGTTGGTLNLSANTVGGVQISDNAKYFEQVGNSKLRQIEPENILQNTVPASDIKYVDTDYSGKISLIVLDDVTGDMYTYGRAELGEVSSSAGSLVAKNTTVMVKNNDTQTSELITATKVKEGDFIGIVPALDGVKAANIQVLESVSGVSRTSFSGTDTIYVTTSEGTFVVSDDVVCYNAVTESWLNSLDEARSFSNDLQLYFDKDADDGGKIRIIVAK